MNIKDKITALKWFTVALVAIVIFLLFKTCNKHVTELPAVVPVEVQAERARVDSLPSKKYKDSVNAVIEMYQKNAYNAEVELGAEKMRYTDLENGINDILNQPIPDTCKPITDALAAQILNLKETNKRKDINCEKAIKYKDNIISSKDALIAKGNEDNKKLKLRFDTALVQQKILTKSLSLMKPKREFYIGLAGISNYNNFNNAAVGLTADYKTRKGVIFGASYFNTKQVQISYKKRLFKF